MRRTRTEHDWRHWCVSMETNYSDSQHKPICRRWSVAVALHHPATVCSLVHAGHVQQHSLILCLNIEAALQRQWRIARILLRNRVARVTRHQRRRVWNEATTFVAAAPEIMRCRRNTRRRWRRAPAAGEGGSGIATEKKRCWRHSVSAPLKHEGRASGRADVAHWLTAWVSIASAARASTYRTLAGAL